jgi:hypothetical protein
MKTFQEHIPRYALGLFLPLLLLTNTLVQQVKAAEQTPVAQAARFADLPESQRLRILIRMIKAGVYDQAELLLNNTPFQARHAENRTLFLQGLIAKGRKKYDLAAKRFRTALANDPKLTMVRAELAHTLFLNNEDAGAKHHLKLLAGAAPTPELAKQFDRFIDAIDARRPWRLSAYVSMAPSTNFNNGTSRTTLPFGGGALVIDANSRKKSGIGIRGGANASYTFKPAKDIYLTVGAGVNFTQYGGKTFDDTIISQTVAITRKYKSGRVNFGVSVSERFSGKDEFIIEAGPYVSLDHRFNNKRSIFAKLRHLRTRFKQADYRNGGTTTLDLRLSHTFAQDTVGYLLSGAQRTTTKRDHLDYWAVYGGAALYKELPFGITLYGEAKATRKLYDGDFPLLGQAQRDTRLDFSASFTKRDFNIFGFAPRLDYTYTKSMSNSVFSEYATHGANISMTKAF